MEWISVKQPPKNLQKVLIKTDCSDCPLSPAYFINGKFIFTTVIQCDKHYETDEKFRFFSALSQSALDLYRDRIIEWIEIKDEHEMDRS